jgi:hypothetical protein
MQWWRSVCYWYLFFVIRIKCRMAGLTLGQSGGPVVGAVSGHVDRLAAIVAPVAGSRVGKARRYSLCGVPNYFRLDIKRLALG